MSLSLIYLKYFCDAVKLGGVSAAAKANFVTQSAISQGIDKLEQSLGVCLVARHPNRFKVTPEGEWAFQEGGDLLKKAGEFQLSLNKEMVGTLEFASTHSLAVSIVPHYLGKFKEAFPEVAVNFQLGGKDKIKQMLKMGIIDFGMMADEDDLLGFESQEILKGAFGMFCAEGLSHEQIERLGFILPDDDCKEVIFLKEFYQKMHRKELPLFLRVNSWEIIANFVAGGFGIGYFPDYVANGKNLLRLSIPDFPYRVCAVYPRGTRLRRCSEAFLGQFVRTFD